MPGQQNPRQAAPTPANRLGLDFRAEAGRLGPPPVAITDSHTHVNGARAAALFRRVCDLYGVDRVYSMTRLEEVPAVVDAFGDRIRFIAVPDFGAADRARAFREDFLHRIERFHALGSRIVKFWAAPRSVDFGREVGDPALMALEGEWRIRAMDLAQSLGMMFMTHIADPDTWFATKYADASVYGTKRAQYEPLERLLDRYPAPWIAAHMGGWPEDLEFLDGLLSRHDNLNLDTSATKWMVRELSRHPRPDLLAFLTKWEGRVLFGSDIVTTDQHFERGSAERGMGHLASTEDEAFDLYAGRYWCLRTLWETDYDGESAIADPDLALVDPHRFDAMSAPRLAGKQLPADTLRTLYRAAAQRLLDAWWEEHA